MNGFTGILKGWWDNVLTPTQQSEILNSVKIEIDPATGTTGNREDAVYTLTQTILRHFVGPEVC